MHKNILVLLGIPLVFSFVACNTLKGLAGNILNVSAENPSVIVKRVDTKGNESVRIYVDGKRVGRLRNGEIWSYKLSTGNHSIYANYDGDDDKNSEIIYFTTNNNIHHFSVEVVFNERNRYRDIKIVQEDVVLNSDKTLANNYSIDDALVKSFNTISENIPDKAIIAIVNIAAEEIKTGEYVMEELTLLFVNSRKYDVVDRGSLEIIKKEQDFQMTGEVDDNSIISIGHILGAGVVITGSVDDGGGRLRLKALDVETAKILAMSSERTKQY